MSPDEFWTLIDLLDGGTGDADLERLTGALRALGRRRARAFQERLAQVLFDLDREVIADQPVRYVDQEPDDEPIPMSDDAFLYVRAEVVARGRAAYEAVLADPTELVRSLWTGEAEGLLYAADEVAGDDVDTRVSYETASNTRHWSPPVEPEREAWDVGPRPVVVDCRDLSRPLTGERPLPDGTSVPIVQYGQPGWLRYEESYELTVALSRPVAVHGGLPPDVGAASLDVRIDVGDRWSPTPAVGPPTVDEEADRGTVRPVTVAVPHEVGASWTADERRRALLALGASCVLAVLPAEHGAVDELRALHRAGADLLPG